MPRLPVFNKPRFVISLYSFVIIMVFFLSFKIVDNFWRMYNYEQTIAKGGSCDVLRVTAKKTSKVWAAKELHSYKHKVDKLFHREVEILRKLDDSHPNIVVLEGA